MIKDAMQLAHFVCGAVETLGYFDQGLVVENPDNDAEYWAFGVVVEEMAERGGLFDEPMIVRRRFVVEVYEDVDWEDPEE